MSPDSKTSEMKLKSVTCIVTTPAGSSPVALLRQGHFDYNLSALNKAAEPSATEEPIIS